MPYKYDAKEAQTSDLVKENDYEATLELIERKVLPSGKNKLGLRWRIRTDVEQEYRNKCLFEDIWEEKDHPDVFNRKRINKLLGTQKDLEDGREFKDINEVINFLKGINCIIHVSVVHDDYRNEDVNTIAFYKPSKVKLQSVVSSGSGTAPQSIDKKIEESKKDIVDDDLPF